MRETKGVLEYEVIWGHIDILVVAIRRLSRRWKAKTMKAEITISPIFNKGERRMRRGGQHD